MAGVLYCFYIPTLTRRFDRLLPPLPLFRLLSLSPSLARFLFFIFTGHHQHPECSHFRRSRCRSKPRSKPTGLEVPPSQDHGLFRAILGALEYIYILTIAAKKTICPVHRGLSVAFVTPEKSAQPCACLCMQLWIYFSRPVVQNVCLCSCGFVSVVQ